MKKDKVYRWCRKSKKKVEISRVDYTNKGKARLKKTTQPQSKSEELIAQAKRFELESKHNFAKNIDVERGIRPKIKDTFKKDYKQNLTKSKINASSGAKKLQAKTPHSERWFLFQLKKLNFPIVSDQYPASTFGLGLQNPHYEMYIPDILNLEYKFIIEIDDKSHDLKKDYDRKRDEYFRNKGIQTYRIIYKDNKSLIHTLHKICNRILASCNEDIQTLIYDWKVNNYI